MFLGINEDIEIHRIQFDRSNSGVRTYVIFTDLPKHIEFRVENLPTLTVGNLIEFNLLVRDSKFLNKSRKVFGVYEVTSQTLKYGGKLPGLAQYLELVPVKDRRQ